MRVVISFLLLVGLVGGGIAVYATSRGADSGTSFRTVAIKRDNLLSTIGATGTLEPEEVVDVGAQIVGRIKRFGIDPSDPAKTKPIDYRSVVHEGTILAVIDDSIYRAQVAQANAALQRANADLLQYKAKRDQASNEWARAQSLHSVKSTMITGIKGMADTEIKAIADTDYDLARANYEAAAANVGVAEAAIKQSQASLDLANTNLAYTIIKSPVEGVIITRRVNVGQTVVASLNAPSLFLIAKDLRRMQVWASVNEADIGRIHEGMPVRFSVDTFPGEIFRGKVAQIRFNASTTQNVVLYTVVVSTDNSDLRLFPYLTTNVQFEVGERRDVLVVPNAALRWKPRLAQVASDARSAVAAILSGKGGPPGAPGGRAAGPKDDKPKKPAKDQVERGRVWVQDGDFVRPVDVVVGATDGSNTEISGEAIREGMEVVQGEVRKDADADDTTNPFAPKLFRGNSQNRKSQS